MARIRLTGIPLSGEDIRIVYLSAVEDTTADPPTFTVDGKPCTQATDGATDFLCSGLGSGTHELDIVNDQGLPILFCIDPGATTLPLGTLSRTTLSSSTATSNPSTTHMSFVTSSSSRLQSPSASPPPTASPASHNLQIIAGVVGGVLFLMAVGAGLLWLRRRRRREARGDCSFLRILLFELC